MAAPHFKLTYFDLDGAGEKIRLAFKVGGIDFVDDRVAFPDWPALKPTTPYGQLPLLSIDGGAPIAQSAGALRYIGRLAGLYPADPLQALAVDEITGLEDDLGRAILPSMLIGRNPALLGHPADISAEGRAEAVGRARAELTKEGGDIPRYLGYLEAKLRGSETGFFLGGAPTIADCQVYPRLVHLSSGALDHVPATILDSYPNLTRFVKVFSEIPAVAAHLAWKAERKAAKAQ